MQVIHDNRFKPSNERLQEVYTDESYIHHHHQLTKDNLSHPEDGSEARAPHKGRRYSFVAAVRENRKRGTAGLVPNSVWKFFPTSGKDHQCDYHKVFNYANHLEWFSEQLLHNFFEPTLIILTTPVTTKMRKAGVLKALSERNVTFVSNITAVEAKLLLRTWICENVKPAVIQIAEEAGHKAIFTLKIPVSCDSRTHAGTMLCHLAET